MAKLTIENLSDQAYEWLRAFAAANRRSIEAEAIALIERGLRVRRTPERQIEKDAKVLREKTPVYLTQKRLRTAIDTGRM